MATAEQIEKDLRILKVQFKDGDYMSREEYKERKQKLENKLEEIKKKGGVWKR